MKRKVFFLSDNTGITAENIGRSLLAQFPNVRFESSTKPFIDTIEKSQIVVKEINEAAINLNERPIVIDTILNEEARHLIQKSNCFYIDIFSSFLSPLEHELNVKSTPTIGHPSTYNELHQKENKNYMQRIDAMHFALSNDDGMNLNQYDIADIILIGISRTGKTPCSVYLGMQYGVKAANYPLTPDAEPIQSMPESLLDHSEKLFGLTISPNRLSQIRSGRLPNSKYSNLQLCKNEIRKTESFYMQHQIPYIDTTQLSVEEISARILESTGIERRLISL